MSTLADRFWPKVDQSGGPDACWPWMLYRDPDGYGKFSPGLSFGAASIRAHRLAYELSTQDHLGPLQIDHVCHNRACCNPAHLRPATPKQQNENRAGAQRNSKSGVRGVRWVKTKGRWRAQVQHNARTIHVGYFDTLEAAAEAVKAKRLELFTHNDIDRRAAS